MRDEPFRLPYGPFHGLSFRICYERTLSTLDIRHAYLGLACLGGTQASILQGRQGFFRNAASSQSGVSFLTKNMKRIYV